MCLVICCGRPIIHEPLEWVTGGRGAESGKMDYTTQYDGDGDVVRMLEVLCRFLKPRGKGAQQTKQVVLVCGGARWGYTTEASDARAILWQPRLPPDFCSRSFQIFDQETRTKITQICVAPLPPSQKVFPASWTLGVEEPMWIVGRFHVSHKIEYDKAEQVRRARFYFAALRSQDIVTVCAPGCGAPSASTRVCDCHGPHGARTRLRRFKPAAEGGHGKRECARWARFRPRSHVRERLHRADSSRGVSAARVFEPPRLLFVGIDQCDRVRRSTTRRTSPQLPPTCSRANNSATRSTFLPGVRARSRCTSCARAGGIT